MLPLGFLFHYPTLCLFDNVSVICNHTPRALGEGGDPSGVMTFPQSQSAGEVQGVCATYLAGIKDSVM